MAIRFIDGFDVYTAASHYYPGRWTGAYNTTPTTPASASGRYAGGAFRWTDIRQGLYKQLDYRATWIVGAAVYHDYYTSGNPCSIFNFNQDTTRHCYLSVNSSGHLEMRLGNAQNGTVIAGNYSYILPSTTWNYIEVKVTIDNTAGAIVVRVGGIDIINVSAVDTQNGANAYANRIILCGHDPGFTNNTGYMDDLYIADTSGAAPGNDFLGDVRVDTIRPNGNGTTSGMTGSDADSVDNYLHVDDSIPYDDDTSYVESDVVGTKDTYAYGDLPVTSGTVYAVQLSPRYKKTNAGSRSAVSVARLSATEEDSAAQPVYDSYLWTPDMRETKPGGGAWTISDVNSAEFGIKVNS